MASYVSPAVRDKFESLSIDLKNCILERNVRLETVFDLIRVLEEIVARGYKTTVEGLSEKFNPEYWNYAKLISGVLRYRMPTSA